MKSEPKRVVIDRRAFLAASLIACSAAKIQAAAKGESGAPAAQTKAGKVRGAMQGKVCTFKGIAYGASTEGAGRFQPAAKVEPWTGVRDALKYGAPSPQVFSNLIPESMAQVPEEEHDGKED